MVLKMAANPTKNTIIRRYLTVKSGVTTGYPALRLDAVLLDLCDIHVVFQ